LSRQCSDTVGLIFLGHLFDLLLQLSFLLSNLIYVPVEASALTTNLLLPFSRLLKQCFIGSGQMARSVGLLPVLVVGALLCATVNMFLGFVSPAPTQPSPHQPMRSHVALRARGGARGGGPDIDAWIAEVTTGSGGEPVGAMKEYIMKWFWRADDPFTGPGKTPGKKDHKMVLQTLKDCVAQGPAFVRGSASAGFASAAVASSAGFSCYTQCPHFSMKIASLSRGTHFLIIASVASAPLLICKDASSKPAMNSAGCSMALPARWGVVRQLRSKFR